MFTSWKRSLLVLCAGVLLAGTVFSQSPPFDGRAVLSGSMTYRESDFTETNGEYVVVEADALRVYAPSSTEETATQHKLAFTPGQGLVARARFRLFIDHIDDNETAFGFYTGGSHPLLSTPDDGAYFHVKEGRDCANCPQEGCDEEDCTTDRVFANVYAVVAGQEPRFVFELDDLVYHDFLVEIDGTSAVRFYHKDPSDGDWVNCGVTCSFTSDLPDGAMQFSAAALANAGGSAGHIRMKIFTFELER
jgi:hypothetical protein